MAKRARTLPRTATARGRPLALKRRPGIVHTSLYLPEPIYEGLREAAFRERCKIHDLLLEGIQPSGSEDGGQGANLETREPTACGLLHHSDFTA
jgi:hypothetical protein